MAFIRLQVLSLGSYFSNPYAITYQDCKIPHPSGDPAPNHSILNISLHLNFDERHRYSHGKKGYRNISGLFLEGLYDSLHGKMYLSGCRQILPYAYRHSTDRGQDCLIEVTLQYPSETARWLIDSTAKLSITSLRSQDDPLYFHPIELQTISPRCCNQDAQFRKAAEGVIRIVILLGMIIGLLRQNSHLKKWPAAAAYVSLAMLSLQLTEYFCQLTVSNAELLLQSVDMGWMYKSHRVQDHPNKYIDSIQEFGNFVYNVLVLAAFLLTLRLYKAIYDSRASLHLHSSNSTNSSGTVGVREKPVILISIAAFLATLVIVFMVRQVGLFLGVIFPPWNFFLFPQIIGNFIWRQNGNAALSRTYYMGMTFLRIFAHVYDCVANVPAVNPRQSHASLELELKNFTARTSAIRIGNMVTLIVMALLAGLVHFQQRRVSRPSKLD